MTTSNDAKRRILVADDDDQVRGFFVRLLTLSGYEVVSAHDGVEARALLHQSKFDMVLSDISMPGLTGIELLRAVRETDLDVPVVLVTGSPSVETAMKAVQYGALRYVEKPVEPQVLLDVVAYAVRIHELARAKRDALTVLGERSQAAADLAGLDAVFSRALQGLSMVYQPIVSERGRCVYAYEALMRSTDPVLPHPGALLDAAERLGRVHELGRVVRDRVAMSITDLPVGVVAFVNMHPAELTDDALFSAMSPLSRVAQRIVLEVTERATLDDIDRFDERIAALRAMGFRFAVDDLGTGYAGLSSFVKLSPEIVKIDMGLVRDLHLNQVKERVVRSIQELCTAMEIRVVAEGVENNEERLALREIGVDLLQGFGLARPSVGFMPLGSEVFAYNTDRFESL